MNGFCDYVLILWTIIYSFAVAFMKFNSACMCVVGEAGFYQRVMSVCSALSRYLLSLPKLPSALQIPPATEHLITSFTTLVIEVYTHTYLHTQFALECLINGMPQLLIHATVIK